MISCINSDEIELSVVDGNPAVFKTVNFKTNKHKFTFSVYGFSLYIIYNILEY